MNENEEEGIIDDFIIDEQKGDYFPHGTLLARFANVAWMQMLPIAFFFLISTLGLMALIASPNAIFTPGNRTGTLLFFTCCISSSGCFAGIVSSFMYIFSNRKKSIFILRRAIYINAFAWICYSITLVSLGFITLLEIQ